LCHNWARLITFFLALVLLLLADCQLGDKAMYYDVQNSLVAAACRTDSGHRGSHDYCSDDQGITFAVDFLNFGGWQVKILIGRAMIG
jgi:hypothetical protein